MVSSKFSPKPPPFRVPAVCKKKTPEPGAQNPDPNQVMNAWFDLDCTFGATHLVRSGNIELSWWFANIWRSPYPPPPDGELGQFTWYESVPAFSFTLAIYSGGVLIASFYILNEPYVDPPNFDTGVFDMLPTYWVGKKQARVHNY